MKGKDDFALSALDRLSSGDDFDMEILKKELLDLPEGFYIPKIDSEIASWLKDFSEQGNGSPFNLIVLGLPGIDENQRNEKRWELFKDSVEILSKIFRGSLLDSSVNLLLGEGLDFISENEENIYGLKLKVFRDPDLKSISRATLLNRTHFEDKKIWDAVENLLTASNGILDSLDQNSRFPLFTFSDWRPLGIVSTIKYLEVARNLASMDRPVFVFQSFKLDRIIDTLVELATIYDLYGGEGLENIEFCLIPDGFTALGANVLKYSFEAFIRSVIMYILLFTDYQEFYTGSWSDFQPILGRDLETSLLFLISELNLSSKMNGRQIASVIGSHLGNFVRNFQRSFKFDRETLTGLEFLVNLMYFSEDMDLSRRVYNNLEDLVPTSVTPKTWLRNNLKMAILNWYSVDYSNFLIVKPKYKLEEVIKTLSTLAENEGLIRRDEIPEQLKIINPKLSEETIKFIENLVSSPQGKGVKK